MPGRRMPSCKPCRNTRMPTWCFPPHLAYISHIVCKVLYMQSTPTSYKPLRSASTFEKISLMTVAFNRLFMGARASGRAPVEQLPALCGLRSSFSDAALLAGHASASRHWRTCWARWGSGRQAQILLPVKGSAASLCAPCTVAPQALRPKHRLTECA